MIDTRRTALVPRRGSAPEAPFQLGFFGCLFCIRKKKGGGLWGIYRGGKADQTRQRNESTSAEKCECGHKSNF